MTSQKKICFFINWVREFNMLETLYENIDKNNFIFVINDLNKDFRSNKNDLLKIKSFLEVKKFDFFFLSKILNKKKFDILISTGDLPISHFTFKNLAKFLYAQTIGYFFHLIKLEFLTKKYLNFDISANGRNANFYDNKYAENQLSDHCIKFPNALDRNIKYFPDYRWKKVFNTYFTSSLMEQELINKKFFEKEIFYVGYPRFYKYHENNLKKSLISEFNLDIKKKNIICLPNERIMSYQDTNSLIEYVTFLEKLDKKYNLILRPHPKLEYFNQKAFEILKSKKLKLDLNHTRKIIDLFEFANLLICDFGSSVVESIYLKKKVIIYSWKNEENFKLLNDASNWSDDLIREKLYKINPKNTSSHKTAEQEIFNIISNDIYQKKINDISFEFFGDLKNIYNPLEILKKKYDNI